MGLLLLLKCGAAVLVLPLAMVACGDDKSGAGTDSATVDIRSFAFAPDAVMVTAGTTVTWTNRDMFEHTVRSETEAFAASERLGEGVTFTQTFGSAGTFRYFCGIHNSMVGTIVVK